MSHQVASLALSEPIDCHFTVPDFCRLTCLLDMPLELLLTQQVRGWNPVFKGLNGNLFDFGVTFIPTIA